LLSYHTEFKMTRLPRFYCWPGPPCDRWSFGWLTGRDNDLVCVRQEVSDPLQGDLALSPVCSNRILAVLAFAAKRFLVAVDGNLMVREH